MVCRHNAWLIEANLAPDMSHSTPITTELIPAMIADTLKVVVDGRETGLPNDDGDLCLPGTLSDTLSVALSLALSLTLSLTLSLILSLTHSLWHSLCGTLSVVLSVTLSP